MLNSSLLPKGLYVLSCAAAGMDNQIPRGLITSLVTPRLSYVDAETGMYRIGQETLESEIYRQETLFKADGVLLGGPVGEGPFLAPKELLVLLRTAGGAKRDWDFPVMASVWGYDPCAEARHAKHAGASHIVVHLHDRTIDALDDIMAIAKAKGDLSFGEEDYDMPIILSNDAKVAGRYVDLDTVARLSRKPLVVGVIDGSGSAEAIPYLVRHIRDGAAVSTTDERTCLDAIRAGAKGVFSSAANIFPKEMATMVHAALGRDWRLAEQQYNHLRNFFEVCSGETDPAVIKGVMTVMGKAVGPHHTLPAQGAHGRVRDVVGAVVTFYPGIL